MIMIYGMGYIYMYMHTIVIHKIWIVCVRYKQQCKYDTIYCIEYVYVYIHVYKRT